MTVKQMIVASVIGASAVAALIHRLPKMRPNETPNPSGQEASTPLTGHGKAWG